MAISAALATNKRIKIQTNTEQRRGTTPAIQFGCRVLGERSCNAIRAIVGLHEG